MSDGPGAALVERLHVQLSDVESAVLTRVDAIADPGISDPDYLIGLRDSVRAAVRYVLHAFEHGVEEAGPPPDAFLNQVRTAARNGVGLDTVLRRCAAAHMLFLDLVIQEAAADRRSPTDWRAYFGP